MSGTLFDWDKIEPRTVIPGFHGRFMHSASMTFVLWQIDAGATLPLHSHPHEQVVHQFEGELEVTVDGQSTVLKPGMVAVVPPHAPHSGRALTACRTMDVFHPLREDYRTGAPSVLQQAMPE
ncbi:cupin domain-containing protein [Labrys sp. La1]|uniref:cupin domain-containing protein n=1 Tax=Labrys sp. La1 TaxID=3404917 RepID=UPI003EBE078E